MNPLLTDVIGEIGEVIEASDSSHIGVQGEIIDETKNTLVIACQKNKVIPKRKTIIQIQGKKFDFNSLRVRPEEKIRKMRRRGKI
jgi:RNase P/RNase MRP subunit p29